MTEPERVPELVCQHQVEVGGVVELEDMNLALGRNQTSVPDVDGLDELPCADTLRREGPFHRVEGLPVVIERSVVTIAVVGKQPPGCLQIATPAPPGRSAPA